MHADTAKLSVALEYLQIFGINSSSAEPFTVPLHAEKNIWNEISKSSFQSILLHSDIAMPSFVSSQYVNILADLTYNETRCISLRHGELSVETSFGGQDKKTPCAA